MLYINGKWVSARSGKNINVTNPATGEILGQVASAGEEDTQEAITAAHRAFPGWAALTAKERASYLKEAADILRKDGERLAMTVTKEMGKPLAESRGEMYQAVDFIDWFAEEGKRVYGDTIPSSSPQKRLMVIKQPIGVVAAVTPWNFPLSMITRKIAPALAAGCTVVFKPASATPLTAKVVFEAFDRAGIPSGVANLVTGSAGEIVGEMMRNPLVRKVTFTGSTEVGKKLMKDAADTMKNISLELGGHAPFLVFEDADLDKAAEGVILSKFRNAGQTCISTNRVFVQQSVVEEFAAVLKEKVARLKIGYGMDNDVQIGPLINKEALQKVEEQVQDAISKGAKLIYGGKVHRDETLNGHFYQPTLLLNADENMKIFHEETFGPVAPIFSFSDEKEAIEKANDSVYGLASYVYTRDLSRAIRVSEALEYGIVGLNDHSPAVVQAPFGGMKESGIGREGGKYGIEEYLETKFISIGL